MNTADVSYVAAGDVDFSGGWDNLWSAVSGEASAILDIATIVGVALIIGSVIAYFWQKRRAGGNAVQGSGAVMWVMMVGAILCAPAVIFPILLNLLDAICNAFLNILDR